MYNIKELELLHQQDVFSLLYINLAESIADNCGRHGEGAVREAVRRFARDRGYELAQEHRSLGIKTNLKSLYNMGYDLIDDPRTRRVVLHEEQDARLWEVYTCPMAELWVKAGKNNIGIWYCEECHRSLIDGYTNGKGQTNLSMMLTCSEDNHCRFSVYYRAANTDGEQRQQSFEDKPAENTLPLEDNISFKAAINAICIKLCYYMVEVSKEYFGAEGLCAVAQGLRSLAPELAARIRKNADATGSLLNVEYIKENFPLSLDSSEDALWSKYGANEARHLVQLHLLDAVSKLI